jgi:hypothetical protein
MANSRKGQSSSESGPEEPPFSAPIRASRSVSENGRGGRSTMTPTDTLEVTRI